MLESLIVIAVSVTILALVFLFLYIKKYQDYYELKIRLSDSEKRKQHEQDIQKVRDDFLAMMIHDLRSPLAVIRGSADLILKEADSLDKNEVYEFLVQIKASSTQLLGMVNDLLDISKIESGRYEVYFKEANLNDILTEESKVYSTLAKEHNVTIDLDLDDNLKHFKFDSDKIKQVLNNLLSNAIKFTPEGGKVVLISKKRDPVMAEIRIKDTGIGVPDEVKPRLFHKFVQGVELGVNHEKGTGLGLVIAKGIVEAHGGTIWMEDNKPKGSVFVFTLPLHHRD
jgi:signal transduction histidine kinase